MKSSIKNLQNKINSYNRLLAQTEKAADEVCKTATTAVLALLKINGGKSDAEVMEKIKSFGVLIDETNKEMKTLSSLVRKHRAQ